MSKSSKKRDTKSEYITLCAALGMIIGSTVGLVKGLYSSDALKYIIYGPIGLILGLIVGAIIDAFKKNCSSK